jgi:hypothetical protein
MVYGRKLFYQKSDGQVEMVLIIMIDDHVYLDAYSELQCIAYREHKFFPRTGSISKKVVNLRIIGVYGKMYEFKSGFRKPLHILVFRTHHPI